jgi:dethiobiotin synthetase
VKPRPARLVFVAGTGTAVGKTWTAAAMLTRLRNAGLRVAARKPAQSFDVGDGPTDADVLARATGEPPHTVCPPHRWYDRALAPPMAADAIGAPPFTVGDLVRELCWSEGVDVGLVEGAGGPRSPIAVDGDNVTLASAIAPDLALVVARADLGAVNAVRMSVDAFAGVPVVVLLNGYEEDDVVHRGNRDWLRDRDGYDVVTGPETAAARIVP